MLDVYDIAKSGPAVVDVLDPLEQDPLRLSV